VAPRTKGPPLAVHAPDRSCGKPSGLSTTARAFGARVTLPLEGRSLFFVVGRDGAPDAIVRAAGGIVVARLPDSRRVLAILSLADGTGLRGHPGLELAGPVSIDAERFARFTELIGLDDARPP
jgi:hypothetical protein